MAKACRLQSTECAHGHLCMSPPGAAVWGPTGGWAVASLRQCPNTYRDDTAPYIVLRRVFRWLNPTDHLI